MKRLWPAIVAIAACRNEVEVSLDPAPIAKPIPEIANRDREPRAIEPPTTAAETRDEVPASAKVTIREARRALAERDFRAFAKHLAEVGMYDVSRTKTVTSKTAAIKSWRSNPALLTQIERALAAPCEVDDLGEAQLGVTCGGDLPVTLTLSNLIDGLDEDGYRILNVAIAR